MKNIFVNFESDTIIVNKNYLLQATSVVKHYAIDCLLPKLILLVIYSRQTMILMMGGRGVGGLFGASLFRRRI